MLHLGDLSVKEVHLIRAAMSLAFSRVIEYDHMATLYLIMKSFSMYLADLIHIVLKYCFSIIIIIIYRMSYYEAHQARLQKLWEQSLLEEPDEEIEWDDDEDLEEEDHLEERDEDSDTEQDVSDIDEESPSSPGTFYLGKDKSSKWRKQVPTKNVRTRSENLVKHLPGPKASTKNLQDPLDIWKYFFNNEMVSEIVEWTNQHIASTASNYSRERDTSPTNISEIHALFGLLYMAGVLKSSRLNLRELYSTQGTGVEIFRLVMSINRIQFLLRHLRFDNAETREERKKLDKLAPIRDVFDAFNENCKTAYTPFHYVTIDEKLEAFRGRCSFRQYIPSKPNKYGIKIFALVDSKRYYTSNLEVYVGQQPPGPFEVSNSPSAVVQRLCEPIKGSGRNVTTDNWFTSMELLEALYKEKLTLLGTIRKNKKELPPEFVNPPKSRPVNSSVFGFRENATLVSFMPKKNKNVLLVSSLHHDDNLDKDTSKPEIIMDYNNTKGGVDTVDKLCASYDCARNTRRWPMVVFYSLLNIAGINSMIIHQSNNISHGKRRDFLRNLAFKLVESHLRVRASLTCLPKTMISRIREIVRYEEPVQPVNENTQRKRGRCSYCDSKKNRPTKYSCKKCGKYMCLEHCLCVCKECYSSDFE